MSRQRSIWPPRTALGTALVIGLAVAGTAEADAIRYELTDLTPVPGPEATKARFIDDAGHALASHSLPPWDVGPGEPAGWLLATDGTEAIERKDLLPTGFAMSPGGRVVGTSRETGDLEFFHWDGDRLVADGSAAVPADLMPEGAEPTAINDQGEVVGIFTSDRLVGYRTSHAFKYSNGTFSVVPGIDGRVDAVYLTDINNRGEILGHSFGSRAGSEPFLIRPDGTLDRLGLPTGIRDGYASEMNEAGQVVGVGNAQFVGPMGHAQLYQDGRWYDLGAVDGIASSLANGINGAGLVVGASFGSDGTVATLFVDGKAIDLNTLIPPNTGWTLTNAFAINDAGQIVGEGIVRASYGVWTHAFLLTPVETPEPSTLAVLLVGAAALAARRRRCRAA